MQLATPLYHAGYCHMITVALQLISCRLPHSLIMQTVATQLMTVALQLFHAGCHAHSLIMQAVATQHMIIALQLISCRLPHSLNMQAVAMQFVMCHFSLDLITKGNYFAIYAQLSATQRYHAG